jgi:hypothetical protein
MDVIGVWSDGEDAIFPVFQFSNTPAFQYSSTPFNLLERFYERLPYFVNVPRTQGQHHIS